MEVKKAATLKSQAYEAIRTAILHRELSREQVYSEKWFADELRISRTPCGKLCCSCGTRA